MLILHCVTFAQAQEILDQWPLATPWAASPEGYFESPSSAEFFDQYVGDDGLDAMINPATEATALLYVPSGDGPFGVMVHIAAEDLGVMPSGWRDALEAEHMIYVAPNGVGNSQSTALRATRALDALASVQAAYDIDPNRQVLGGFSGGAAIAVMTMAHWPDQFVGVIDECRAVMWEDHEIASIPGSVFGRGEVDDLEADLLEPLVAGPRFAFASGDEDVQSTSSGPFMNYEGIMDGIGDWWDRGIRARVWDIPGQSHARIGGQVFGSALSWVLDCTDDGLYPPRFDSDHLPPHTPFAAPDAPPPEACDAAPPGGPNDTASEAADGKDAAGCGCQSVPSAPPWPFAAALATVLGMRRTSSGRQPGLPRRPPPR